jgi:transposase InsO family protein
VQKKIVIETLVSTGSCGVARACRLFGLARSAVYRRGTADVGKMAQEGLVAETSRAHPCLGYRKVTAILRDGHGETINPKRVARLRRRDGLQASRKQTKRRRIKPQVRARQNAGRRDEVWSYDFIQDSLADGSTVRILSVIDEYSRECVLLRSARSFPSRRVIDCLEELLVTTGRKPEWLRSDNGPEFVASQVQGWLKSARVGSAYITPGSPWENGHVESFHASLRAEFLNRELFFSMKEVSVMLEDWRHHYNHERPHGSLSNKPPVPKSTIAKSSEKKKTNPRNSH